MIARTTNTYHLVDPSPWPFVSAFLALMVTFEELFNMQDCGESAFLLKCGFLLLAFVLFIYKALFYFSRKVTTTSVFFCFLLLLILAFIYTFPQVLVMSDWLLTSEILNIALIVIKKAPTISDLVFGDPAPPDKDFWWFLLNAAIALLVAGAISLVLTPPSRKGRKRAGK